MDPRGKVAVVTGGARRLGRAFVLALASRGARVVVHYFRSAADAERTAADARALGAEAVTLEADLAEEAPARALIAESASRLGPVEILVNSAAIFEPGGPEDTTSEAWDRHFAINLRAPFLLSRELRVRLPEGRAGKIVNVGDWRGLRPDASHLAYSLTKSALIALTQSLAAGLAPSIQVNGLALGAILLPAGAQPGLEDRLIARIPAGRMGDPGEVARALLFLLEDDFVTGQTIVIDGGRSLV